MKRQIGTFAGTMTIIGTVIGAGFASGQEIATFFGFGGIISLILTPVLFLISFLLINLLFKSKCYSIEELGKTLFGKFSFILTAIFYFCQFCILSSMLAGLRSICTIMNRPNFFVPLFCMAGIITYFGFSSVLKVNSLLLPILISCLVSFCLHLVFFQYPNFVSAKVADIPILTVNLFLYISMNIFCAIPIILPLGPSSKSPTKTALFSVMFICLLFLLLFLAINTNNALTKNMPMLYLSQSEGKTVKIICCVILIVATFTTLTSCSIALTGLAQRATKSRALSVLLVFLLSSTASIFGFSKIVKYVYPSMGLLGLLVFLCLVWKFCMSKKSLKIARKHSKIKIC